MAATSAVLGKMKQLTDTCSTCWSHVISYSVWTNTHHDDNVLDLLIDSSYSVTKGRVIPVLDCEMTSS